MANIKYPTLPVGSVVLNKYRVTKVIGGGGMSTTYKCEDITLENVWCLKEIRRGDTPEERQNARAIISEAYIMRKLNHPGIPRIVTIQAEEDRTYIVMDWIDGKSLGDILKTVGKLDAQRALNWTDQICDIMLHLHMRDKPIIYRDLKPDNIQIKEETQSVVMLDFGISVEIDKDNTTIKNTMGTAGFAAPEMFFVGLPYDLRSDIYTIGATMYTMLTGYSPKSDYAPGKEQKVKLYDEYKNYLNFKDENSAEARKLIAKLNEGVRIKVLNPVTDICPEVPRRISNIVQKAMQPLPKDRYQNVAELKADLQEYFSDIDYHRGVMLRKVWITGILFAGIFLFAGLSLLPSYLMNKGKESQYELLVTTAESTQKTRDWISVIQYKPYIISPYFGLIDSFMRDGTFTAVEEKELFSVMFSQEDLKRDERYGELCYKLGILYWYYYEEDDAQISSMKWFEESMNAGYEEEKSRNYYNLGNFTQEATTFTTGLGKDISIYSDYWNNLLDAQTYAAAEENILFNLQIYTTIVDYLSTSSYNLKRSGIEEKEVRRELNLIRTNMEQIKSDAQTTPKTTALFEELEEKLNRVDTYVTNGYKSV